MTITREINGEQVKIELTDEETKSVKSELELKSIIYDIEHEAEDMESELTDEQIRDIAERVLEHDEEYEYYYDRKCDHTDYIQELIDEVLEEDEA